MKVPGLKSRIKTKQKGYDFESVQDYYDNRNENFIVGIIDKKISQLSSDSDDLFKIRPPLKKIVGKKPGFAPELTQWS